MNEQLEQAIKTVAQWENHDRFRVTEAEKSLWSNDIEPDDVALAREFIRVVSKVDGLVEHVKSLEAEVEELRAIKFKRFNDQECWIYQGDGEDNLFNLVCPVVVSPQKMIELEAASKRAAELERGEYICKQCGLRKDAEQQSILF